MKLSALIQKRENATATVATPATHNSAKEGTVAKVASVTVANQLFAEEETAIRAWLAHVKETDPVIITEVLDKCRVDLETRHFFIRYSQKK